MQELIHVPPNSVTGKRCPMCGMEVVHVVQGKTTLWIDYASIRAHGNEKRFAGYEHECKRSKDG